jgi:DNA-binding transcriptional regulator GbsR (MarR family)
VTTPRDEPDGDEAAWPDFFVEELGARGPELGFPRAMMRVTAWMMVCHPPEQSAGQIQDGLRLSPAAVSSATRQLISTGMLERVSRPGDRRIYYRLRSGSWAPPLEARLRALTRLREVADRAIKAAGERSDHRLIEMRDTFAWLEDRLGEYVALRHPSR